MNADRALPEPGTRVRVTFEGRAADRDFHGRTWVDGVAAVGTACLDDPGVTWEPVEPREWADGDVVAHWDEDGYAYLWQRIESQWVCETADHYEDDAGIDWLLTDPHAKVRVIVRGGCDV